MSLRDETQQACDSVRGWHCPGPERRAKLWSAAAAQEDGVLAPETLVRNHIPRSIPPQILDGPRRSARRQRSGAEKTGMKSPPEAAPASSIAFRRG